MRHEATVNVYLSEQLSYNMLAPDTPAGVPLLTTLAKRLFSTTEVSIGRYKRETEAKQTPSTLTLVSLS